MELILLRYFEKMMYLIHIGVNSYGEIGFTSNIRSNLLLPPLFSNIRTLKTEVEIN